MSKSVPTGLRLPVILYALALIAGLALAYGFARVNKIHGEFLEANFDAVHGARTLLKARYFLAQAEGRLSAAISDPERRAKLIALTFEALDLAESYGAEGRDADPNARVELTARMRSVRESLGRLQAGNSGSEAQLDEAASAIHRLAGEYEAAELDRWGNLSSLNAELAARMEQMRLFVAAIVVGFVMLMGFLGWALLRARRAGIALQHAIEDVEAIQQTTLDASPVGIIYVDHIDRRILLANRQMAAMFGYSTEALMQLPIAELHRDAESYALFANSIRADLERGLVPGREVRMRRRCGEIFWCALTGKAIEANGPMRRMVWICEDISERKNAELELRAAREKAEAASRAKSDFLANVSHEIRTPFTAILGVLDLLGRTVLSTKQGHYLDMAQQSTKQLLTIVNDILDISRIEAGKLSIDPVDFDARQLCDEIAHLHEATAMRKGLGFAYRFDAEAPTDLAGDPVRIRQIADNLLANAIKFTDHGRVELRVCCSADADRNVLLRIEVTDTGIGIAEEQQTLIFNTFTQVDTTTTRNFGGTGLGLSICRNLAQLMGGRIGVDSVQGSGSRFWLELELPAAAAHPPPATADSEPEIVLDLSGRRVLIADDADLNREVLIESLAETGCQIRLADNGLDAVEIAASWHPDLILMDCQMPVMDGYTATREIRLRAGEHNVIIVAITAHAMHENREKCLAAGMDDYLVKPISRRDFFARVAYWLKRDSADPVRKEGSIARYPQFDGSILLVDNDAGVCDACRSMLEAMGCAVVTASSGGKAMEASDRADFDLVLMDCHMPGMDGWEATRAWREREGEGGRPRTAIVAMTGSASATDLRRCRDAGMDDFLAKPFASDGLVALLSRWLGAAASR